MLCYDGEMDPRDQRTAAFVGAVILVADTTRIGNQDERELRARLRAIELMANGFLADMTGYVTLPDGGTCGIGSDAP
jgi:hypothetical protein